MDLSVFSFRHHTVDRSTIADHGTLEISKNPELRTNHCPLVVLRCHIVDLSVMQDANQVHLCVSAHSWWLSLRTTAEQAFLSNSDQHANQPGSASLVYTPHMQWGPGSNPLGEMVHVHHRWTIMWAELRSDVFWVQGWPDNEIYALKVKSKMQLIT